MGQGNVRSRRSGTLHGGQAAVLGGLAQAVGPQQGRRWRRLALQQQKLCLLLGRDGASAFGHLWRHLLAAATAAATATAACAATATGRGRGAAAFGSHIYLGRRVVGRVRGVAAGVHPRGIQRGVRRTGIAQIVRRSMVTSVVSRRRGQCLGIIVMRLGSVQKIHMRMGGQSGCADGRAGYGGGRGSCK